MDREDSKSIRRIPLEKGKSSKNVMLMKIDSDSSSFKLEKDSNLSSQKRKETNTPDDFHLLSRNFTSNQSFGS